MTEIMDQDHPHWQHFRQLLRWQIWPRGQKSCPGMKSKPLTEKILKKHFPTVDIPATMDFFEQKGGYCDCEVLLNVT